MNIQYYDKSFNDGKNILVFGSNTGGFHGAGAAKAALEHWGAKLYQGEGLQGQSYGIPTKDKWLRTLELKLIKFYVDRFKKFAAENPERYFLITRIGCGYAGYDDKEIAPMFVELPANCQLPNGWVKLM